MPPKGENLPVWSAVGPTLLTVKMWGVPIPKCAVRGRVLASCPLCLPTTTTTPPQGSHSRPCHSGFEIYW